MTRGGGRGAGVGRREEGKKAFGGFGRNPCGPFPEGWDGGGGGED